MCCIPRYFTVPNIQSGAKKIIHNMQDRRQSYDRKMRGYQEKRKGISALPGVQMG